VRERFRESRDGPAADTCPVATPGCAPRAILAPEDVILYKSLGARDKDRIAIAAIARAQSLDGAYIEKWSRHLDTWTFLAGVLTA
jgi:hypothetical protein